MKNNIRDRLRRLGVHKGAGHLIPAPRNTARFGRENTDGRDESAAAAYERAPRSSASDAPLWNIELETACGLARVRRTRYPLHHQHGGWSISDVLAHPPHLLARLNNGSGFDPHAAVFLDTETTGLAGGAGTLAFLVGVGYFERSDVDGETFTIDQYFLHEPAEEAAMLGALNERIGSVQALVTFNGRGFDVPLLETRFTLARMHSGLNDLSHLDLLVPARRAWRTELDSCSLGSLEYHMLGVRRDQQDIPGFLIPQLYRAYLIDHQPAEMQRVMYHNLYDILSMVTLVSRLCGAVDAPANVGEVLAAGQYYERRQQWLEAEAIYTMALENMTGSALYTRVLYRMAEVLKRHEQREHAAPYWRRLAQAGDVAAWTELAKHYEWHEVDLTQALACAEQALPLARDDAERAEIIHRIERLKRKANA